jgi:hypothetical protein
MDRILLKREFYYPITAKEKRMAVNEKRRL